ncbi:amino acid permease family protein [Mycobacterium avium subsp. avium 2285 (R)]|nr:amino acid permease family protein [Mycobacterium avium subsp. avium 2285 (R)]
MVGAHVAPGTADHLRRGIGTFQLTMFGVGSTIGTGIFFVMSQAVPEAGPAVIVSFLLAGVAAGLAAVCYAELASAVPVSGSSYSYAYTTLGEVVAMGVAACLLLEYGVATAAVSVNWSGYLNKLLSNVVGFQLPHALSAAPWDAQPGYVNLPAVMLIGMCALLLIRGASESAKVNAIMVMVKLGVLVVFGILAFTAFDMHHLDDFAPFGVAGVGTAAGTIFFSYIGLDAVSTAGDEVTNPQKTMPRALNAALLTVTGVYVFVALAALGRSRGRTSAVSRRPGSPPSSTMSRTAAGPAPFWLRARSFRSSASRWSPCTASPASCSPWAGTGCCRRGSPG